MIAMRKLVLAYLSFGLSMIEILLRPLFKMRWYKSYIILLLLRHSVREG
jgi:hypothetical protein